MKKKDFRSSMLDSLTQIHIYTIFNGQSFRRSSKEQVFDHHYGAKNEITVQLFLPADF